MQIIALTTSRTTRRGFEGGPMARFTKPGLLMAILLLAGCQTTAPERALQLPAASLDIRQMQTRRFAEISESQLLSASAGVLQDLGFNLDESETRLGLVVASKERDATETGQVIGAILLAALFGAPMPIDKVQKISASLVTRPFDESGEGTAVRITFQRIVWNSNRQISKTEALTDPELYQRFFEKLSKAVFLEAHEI
jgi:hypothetical protein